MKKAFTLIELLVVVLIIGILAAVAVPQYQRAVLKSRFASLFAAVNAVAQAEEIYYLANGEYTTDLEALDVTAPAGAAAVWNNSADDNWAIWAITGPVEYLVWPRYSKIRPDKKVCRVYLNQARTEDGKAICFALKNPGVEIFKSSGYWEYFL